MRRNYAFYVYILASTSGTLYIGVTNNLLRRLDEHKNKLVDGFTKKYNCDKLIYYERFSNISVALYREKEIKKWRREKKENLIATLNPHWNDLSKELL